MIVTIYTIINPWPLRLAGIKPSTNLATYNKHVESFFRTFKTELFHGVIFEEDAHLYNVTKWYLEDYYTCRRMHTFL